MFRKPICIYTSITLEKGGSSRTPLLKKIVHFRAKNLSGNGYTCQNSTRQLKDKPLLYPYFGSRVINDSLLLIHK